jgi:hypothetical protein
MEHIIKHSKEYEQILLSHDPHYDNVVTAIKIVKDFIIKHKLIIYGGSAIDYALRLHGSSIYHDESLATPDLDFYSPGHAEHSYMLADILYQAGFRGARAIVATYTRTMRVDAVDNHFIADISYVPKEIFDLLPYVEYESMRIIHPDFQRIDVHSSLSIPFGNPPMEDIFSRWKKDIERFNMLVKYYPIETDTTCKIECKLSIPVGFKKYVFSGVAAYVLIYNDYKFCMQNLDATVDSRILPGEVSISDDSTTIQFTLRGINSIEIAHMDINKTSDEMKLSDISGYEPYFGLLPETIYGKLNTAGGSINVTLLSTRNKLIACNSIQLNDSIKLRITNCQYLLKYFLAMYFKDKVQNLIYLKYYCSIIMMIESYETALMNANKAHLAADSPLFPTIDIYGADNKSLSYEVSIARINNIIKGGPRPIIPMNYYPEKSQPHPTFDYESSDIFKESGKLIKK